MTAGRCKHVECMCVAGAAFRTRFLCPHWYLPERQRGALDNAQCVAFDNLPEPHRRACVRHLRNVVPMTALGEWIDQYQRGVSIGCTDPRFHLGVGKAVRNALREVLPDEQLPAGQWDDYYRGALYAVCEASITPREGAHGA